MPEESGCPLCSNAGATLLHHDGNRDFYRCLVCALVFVPAAQQLSSAAEKAIYDQHENSPHDPGYRAFLQQLAGPLSLRLAPGASGLDFGSGPGPTLSVMLTEAGFQMQHYDPFYQPDLSVFDRRYDFVTATEVFEHLHRPAAEIQRLAGLLEAGGWLAVMTSRIPADKPFSQWHYTRDPTHVIFFAEKTFHWIARQYGFESCFVTPNVVLLQKV